jgi:hypothetical protein
VVLRVPDVVVVTAGAVVVTVGAVVVLEGAVVVGAGAVVVVGAERVPVPPPPPPPVPVCASAKPNAPVTNAADTPATMMNFLMSSLLFDPSLRTMRVN